MSSHGNSSVKQNPHCSHSSKRSTDTRPLRAALEKLSIESICLLQVDRSLHRRSTGTESATTTTTAKARPATLKKKNIAVNFACIGSKNTECTHSPEMLIKCCVYIALECIHQVKNTADLPNRGRKEYPTCLPTANHTTKTSKGGLKFTNQHEGMNMAWKYQRGSSGYYLQTNVSKFD